MLWGRNTSKQVSVVVEGGTGLTGGRWHQVAQAGLWGGPNREVLEWGGTEAGWGDGGSGRESKLSSKRKQVREQERVGSAGRDATLNMA